MEVGPISVPTLYIWGEDDQSVGRAAATYTAQHVTGPYRFEAIPGIAHFITDQIPAAVTRLLLSHLAATPR
jgi:pimeloyl-ACP methyl ester carboxylesterase